MTDKWASIPALLTSLEDLELPLLAWGVVTANLSDEEVRSAITEQMLKDMQLHGAATPSVDEYLDQLVDTGLIRRLSTSHGAGYRTRVAEYIKLLKQLRQLFPPPNLDAQDWWLGYAPLVADYRLRVSPRTYPARDTSPDVVRDRLHNVHPNWVSRQDAVLQAVLGARSAARFQVAASEAILSALKAGRESGYIVTAGTGSGKTLAFYLPALLDLADSLSSHHRTTHTLALYPRVELLRDQARECIRMVRRVDASASSLDMRPVRVGLLYARVPWSAADLSRNYKRYGWRQRGTDFLCPYFSCPADDCDGDLVWRKADRDANRERLYCDRCGTDIKPETLAITRDSMTQQAPDIVFTTTEMLSRQATDPKLGRLLGWTGANPFKLVLLDEAHTYSGVHGAQVALTLRRWREALRRSGSSPVFVGLSATLRNSEPFFSRLSGIDERSVEAITPSASDLVPIGREYAIVVRGDPVSGTSLLSTTIQTTMLSARMLDSSPGIFGASAFIFTDDLDVTNRLFDDLRDAEGRPTRAGAATRAVLADLRGPRHSQVARRDEDGQNWELPDRLGRMSRPLRVGRTSSQDSGVDVAADVIVATGSLEVGFNDPRVGLVMQHKAPRDSASFIQRRGRAGRSLQMRPITTVVLSGYGRDHVAYQTYEQLLDPEVDARNVPVGNRYVLKIQGAHVLLDWILTETGADARAILTPPTNGGRYNTAPVVHLLHRLVEDEGLRRRLRIRLQRALDIGEDQALGVLWDEPRSLMLSVVPTALRRLESDWKSVPNSPDPGASMRNPLPEFMTATLFEALNTPDVELELPPGFPSDEAPRMEILQALREAVPGRVSRRFGYWSSDSRTWLPLPASGSTVELTDLVAVGQQQGSWTGQSGDSYLVVRPLRLRLQVPPADVTDYSSAQPRWDSEFLFDAGNARDADVPSPSQWDGWVSSVRFATHAMGTQITIRRLSFGADYDLARSGSGGITRVAGAVTYTHGGQAAALGYEGAHDAMIVDARIPDDWRHRLAPLAAHPAWRTRSFRQRMLEDERLDGNANFFQRTWLVDLYLHAYALAGLRGEQPPSAVASLAQGGWARDVNSYLAVVYRQSLTPGVGNPARTLATLQQLAADPTVRAVVDEHATLLTRDNLFEVTADLVHRAMADTLAAAISASAGELLADSEDADFLPDVVWSDDRSRFRIVLSESSIGGLGLVEQLQLRYARDPRSFWSRVSEVLGASDYEEVDQTLRAALSHITDPNDPLAQAVKKYRATQGATEAKSALDRLISAWTATLGSPSHLEVSTFATRVLRPGGSPDTDEYLRSLLQQWDDLEGSMNVEVDARTVAYAAAQGLVPLPTRLEADVVYSLLWLRGPSARAQRLIAWQPFGGSTMVERLVIDPLAASSVPTVDVTVDDWPDRYRELLSATGEVDLVAALNNRAALSHAVRATAALPIERGPLRVFGRVTGYLQRMGFVRARVSITEEFQ